MITLITKIKLFHYYVYIHRKASNGEIFYVGKGKNNRCTSVKNRSKCWKHIHNKHGVTCEIVANSLMENEAFLLEKKLIKDIGRRDLNLGTLVNLTDGGDGVTNYKITDARRLQIKESSTGRRHTDKTKELISAANKGKIVSDVTKSKLSASKKGLLWTDELRASIIGKRKSNYKSVICIETGDIYESAVAASKAINGDPSLISKVCRGVRPSYRGFHWKFVNDLDNAA